MPRSRPAPGAGRARASSATSISASWSLVNCGSVGRPSRSRAGCASESRRNDESREHLPLHLCPGPPYQRLSQAPLPAEGPLPTKRPQPQQALRPHQRPCFHRRAAPRCRRTGYLRTLGSRPMVFAAPGQDARAQIPRPLRQPAVRQGLAAGSRAARGLVRPARRRLLADHHLRHLHRVCHGKACCHSTLAQALGVPRLAFSLEPNT